MGWVRDFLSGRSGWVSGRFLRDRKPDEVKADPARGPGLNSGAVKFSNGVEKHVFAACGPKGMDVVVVPFIRRDVGLVAEAILMLCEQHGVDPARLILDPGGLGTVVIAELKARGHEVAVYNGNGDAGDQVRFKNRAQEDMHYLRTCRPLATARAIGAGEVPGRCEQAVAMLIGSLR